ncbi:hypothetical protein TNCV_3632741 [Trichonephila clavipes]|nr:hypothetical protein TNCV_3632741 [Trichonephila clavipes]
MSRSGGQSEARPPVFKSPIKLIYRSTAVGMKVAMFRGYGPLHRGFYLRNHHDSMTMATRQPQPSKGLQGVMSDEKTLQYFRDVRVDMNRFFAPENRQNQKNMLGGVLEHDTKKLTFDPGPPSLENS